MTKYEMQRRLKNFAYEVAKIADKLPRNSVGRYFENQMVRSAFSAAANYRAACIGQSRASFVAKLSIAFEESDETVFWLECIHDLSLIEETLLEKLLKEARELAKILGSARKNAQ